MAGKIEAADTAADLPRWPLDDSVDGSDEQRLALIAAELGWDERAYEKLIADVCQATLGEPYHTLIGTVLGVLDYTPQLDWRWVKETIGLAVKRMEE